MYFEANADKKYPHLVSHWNTMWANRNWFDKTDKAMMAAYNSAMPRSRG